MVEDRPSVGCVESIDDLGQVLHLCRMLKRGVDDHLHWGPGHRGTGVGPYDMYLWADVATAYLEGALALYEQIEARERAPVPRFDDLEARPRDAQALVWPFVNLARQGIELLLKTLVVCRCQLERDASVFLAGHRLMDLWREARKVLQDLPDVAGRDKALAQLVQALASLDPDGQGSRYPANRAMDALSNLLVDTRFFRAGIWAEATLDLSEIARWVQTVQDLAFTADLVDEILRYEKEMHDEY